MQVETASVPALNRLELTARLVDRAPLRLTPAGIPVLDCVLEHQSEQVEAGSRRQVNAQIRSMAVGPLAEQLERMEMGCEARFAGFLATPARRGGVVKTPRLVFHLQAFQTTVTP